jgi:hypothetical protein
MRKRLLIFTPIALILAAVLYVAYSYHTKKPPIQEINQAAKKLSEAEALKADYYAKDEFRKAKTFYDSAYSRLSFENSRNIVSRDYNQIIVYSEISTRSAEAAIEKTKNYLSSVRGRLLEQIRSTERMVVEFDSKYKHYPIRKSDKEGFVRSKLLLNESKLNFDNKSYEACAEKVNRSEKILTELHNRYHTEVSKYFEQYDLWKEWISDAIAVSKRNKSNCIIVDKYAREVRLYAAGKLHSTYDTELSENWIGNKFYQGDKATPEGNYKVKSKKSNGSTKYYKALLIDYPNDQDKDRFIQNKKDRIIQQNAKIGNLIEIHGGGGKGYDWTDGCVAVTNSDMDKIFKFAQVGTPVTIVGSSVPFEDARKALAQKLGGRPENEDSEDEKI